MEDSETKEWLNQNMHLFEAEHPDGKTESQFDSDPVKSRCAVITIHDITPRYSDRIARAANTLLELGVPFNLAIIPRFMGKKEFELQNNIDWLKSINGYEQPMALHGLYHEDENGNIENYHNFDYHKALRDMREGLNIFARVGLKTDIFIPPAWKVNVDTIKAALNLELPIAETDEELLLLMNKTRLRGGVLNWDQGSPERNKQFLKLNKQYFKEKISSNSHMIRLAIHPKDPVDALDDQREMVQILQEKGYEFIRYNELITRFGQIKSHNY